jgi:hypothetical protein
MDEFIDELLHNDRVCDTILPRLVKRFVLEESGDLPPRISPLEEELEYPEDEEEAEVVNFPTVEETPTEPPPPENPTEDGNDLIPKETKGKGWSKKKVKSLFKKVEKKKVVQTEDQEEEKPSGGFKDINLTFHESNILRANLGIAPLKPPLQPNK